MPSLEELEEQYREARETFAEDRTDENHRRYKEAKQELVEARVAQRREEELDPNHSRGNVMAVVDNDGEGE